MRPNLTINAFVLFYTLVLFFSSCTIEKRKYRNGYHVEWNGADRKEKQSFNIQELSDISLLSVPVNEHELSVEQKPSLTCQDNYTALLKSEKMSKADISVTKKFHEADHVESSLNNSLNSSLHSITREHEAAQSGSQPPQKELNTYALLSFLAGTFAWVLLLMGFLLASEALFAFIIFAIMFAAFAVILSHPAIRQIKKDEGNQRGRELAWIGRILGYVLFGLALTYAILVVVFVAMFAFWLL